MIIRRGDIYYADLRPVIGSEQGGVRPVLVIQNDYRQQAQPDRDLRGDHIKDEQKPSCRRMWN
ncbi:MAG: type II toxin-antitoxin system PemK/MazF family toxin [Clostridium fessum]